MSATDQFPPRYLLDEDEAQSSTGTSNQIETRPADDTESSGAKQQLYLPAPEAVGQGKQEEGGGAARTLDVSTGGKVALDELGPMVVSTTPSSSSPSFFTSLTALPLLCRSDTRSTRTALSRASTTGQA